MIEGKTISKWDQKRDHIIMYFTDGSAAKIYQDEYMEMKLLKTFKIPVLWTMTGEMSVSAISKDQAIELALEQELPKGEYLDDSFEILNDEIEDP
jgi:hypothetical protein